MRFGEETRGYASGVPRITHPVPGTRSHDAPVTISSPTPPEPVELVLRVPGEPESLTVIRHAVGGVATAIGLEAAAIADLRLALTEVVTAAVRRSEGERQAIEVRAEHRAGALRVTVRDSGHALPINGELPLPLVAAISDAVELTHLPGGGTAVTMTFRREPLDD